MVSGSETNSDRTWPFVLVCPLSSSTHHKTRYCVKLSASEAGKKTWVRVPAVQPLLKGALEDMMQTLSEERLQEVHARVVEYMGLLVDLGLDDSEAEEEGGGWAAQLGADLPVDMAGDDDIPF